MVTFTKSGQSDPFSLQRIRLDNLKEERRSSRCPPVISIAIESGLPYQTLYSQNFTFQTLSFPGLIRSYWNFERRWKFWFSLRYCGNGIWNVLWKITLKSGIELFMEFQSPDWDCCWEKAQSWKRLLHKALHLHFVSFLPHFQCQYKPHASLTLL